MQIRDVEPALGLPLDRLCRNVAGLIARVVQHLDLEQMARVIELADSLDQAVRHVHFIENRKLDGDARQWIERRGGLLGYVVPVLHVKIHEVDRCHP